MEARIAALERENEALLARIEALESSDKKPASKPKEKEKNQPSKKQVDWSLIPVPGELHFTMGGVIDERATFSGSKEIVSVRYNKMFKSINEWATKAMTDNMVALKRTTATLNVYNTPGLKYKNAAGVWVPLSTIQSIVKVPMSVPVAAPAPAPVALMAGGGGNEPMGESQDSQTGVDCWKCGNFVADDEAPCPCATPACINCTKPINAEAQIAGKCVECGNFSCFRCGINEKDQCMKCCDSDLGDIDVKGKVCLFNSATREVFVKDANGLPGDKISTFVEDKHVWEWAKKKIGDAFYQINHFNYVKQTATAGGAFVGIYDPATKVLTQTPVPEDL